MVLQSYPTDLALLVLRATLGAVFVLHGWNHGFGPSGIQGTVGWFEGIGLRPARIHALVSTYLELAVGAALLLGLLTPFAAAAGIGVMATAFVTVHRANGFFIFREGYEYVLLVTAALTALALLGPGGWSLDHAVGLDLDGLGWGLGALAAGLLGTAALLITSWRPRRSDG